MKIKGSLKEIQKKTGIPVPTLEKFRSGKIQLSEKSIDKLRKYFTVKIKEQKAIRAKENYIKARKAGLSSKEANSVKNRSARTLKNYLYMRKKGMHLEKAQLESCILTYDEAKKEADRIYEYAKIIAKNNGAKLKHVIDGMKRSQRVDDQDWQKYVEKRKAENWVPLRYDKKVRKMVPVQSGKMLSRYKRRVKEGLIA